VYCLAEFDGEAVTVYCLAELDGEAVTVYCLAEFDGETVTVYCLAEFDGEAVTVYCLAEFVGEAVTVYCRAVCFFNSGMQLDFLQHIITYFVRICQVRKNINHPSRNMPWNFPHLLSHLCGQTAR
jgi:hypothetical protein